MLGIHPPLHGTFLWRVNFPSCSLPTAGWPSRWVLCVHPEWHYGGCVHAAGKHEQQAVSFQQGPGRHLLVARCRRGGAEAAGGQRGTCRSASCMLQRLQPVRHMPLVLGRCCAPVRAGAQGKEETADWMGCARGTVSQCRGCAGTRH